MQTVTFEIHYANRPMDKADVVAIDIDDAWERVRRAFPSAAAIEFVSSRLATSSERKARW